MPFVGAAVGAIGTAIAGAGSAVLGGLSTLAATGAGAVSSLGGLATTGIGAVSGLFKPGYGEPGGPIGPAEGPGTLSVLASKVLPIVQAGSKVYGMFQKPDDQPTAAQPAMQPAAPTSSVVPANILNTLPNLIRGPAPAQIITTPPTLIQAPENLLMKYAPWIAAAVIGYIVLGK